jgi:hypothetical protein
MTITAVAGGGEYKGCVLTCHWLKLQSVQGGGEAVDGGGSRPVTRIVIIGGGPGGYEAALVAAQLDADVTLVEADGAGGACVLSDCVPSKTFIASSEVVTGYRHNERFGSAARGSRASRWTRSRSTSGSGNWRWRSPATSRPS